MSVDGWIILALVALALATTFRAPRSTREPAPVRVRAEDADTAPRTAGR